MAERSRFERELDDLQVRQFQGGPPPKPPTVGFEFDVHYGLIEEVVTDAGKSMPANGSLITTHDPSVHGFEVKLDGPRLEVSTKPFTVDAAGRKEWADAVTHIKTFSDSLLKGCRNATPKSITISGVTGKARPFTLAETRTTGLPIVKLPVKGAFGNCSVWASPQATITIPLSSVGALIQRIRDSEGKGPGKAMTGHGSMRAGVRSEALYKAKDGVERLWKQIVNQKPRLKLSNGTEVNSTTFTANLKGFLILLTTYLWTGELTYKTADYEPFAKAYLPLNVKAPFSRIRRELLSTTETMMFDEIFASATGRLRMFRLVRAGATASDGARKLFPKGPKELGLDSVHERQRLEFSSVPTWDDLFAHTVNSAHNSWGDRLLVPLSQPIDLGKTKPRVPLEMRRFGFASVGAHLWADMMKRVFDMVDRLK